MLLATGVRAMNDERESRGGHDRVHTPVLVREVVTALADGRDPSSLDGWIIDGTVGAGGHSRAMLEAFPNVRVFGIDQDPDALELARAELAPFGDRVKLARGRISRLCGLCGSIKLEEAIGVLYDLGANSLHFDRAERGFSFAADGPLDMRMDPSRRRTAEDIVNEWDEEDLADLFYYEGGERRSRAIAAAIVEARRRVPFRRTAALAETVASAIGHRGGRIHPATRVFQALRRAVNEEGDELRKGLRIAEHVLVDGGVLVVLTFHSGEDGATKRYLAERAKEGLWKPLSKKPIGPSRAERHSNPRARSARLRAARRLRRDA